MKTTTLMLLVFALFFSAGKILGEQLTPIIGQKDKMFTVENLKVKVGDTVAFMNDDPFFHNVFSLSPAATFDLGSYPLGESRTVTFEETGEVLVECAIHPSMQMVIKVEK